MSMTTMTMMMMMMMSYSQCIARPTVTFPVDELGKCFE